MSHINLYQPHKKSATQLKNDFCIRETEFELLKNSLLKQTDSPLQHFLILGKRGMGKSTLLRRLEIECFENQKLDKKIISVYFGNENRGLNKLYWLWIKILEQLAPDKYSQIASKKKIEEYLIPLIKETLSEQKKTLLILMDNFDVFLGKLKGKEQRELREVLHTLPIQIIGNSLYYDEKYFDYRAPFYDFFKPIRLENLDEEEALAFLRNYAKDTSDFEERLKDRYAQFKTLFILAGGVPRTLLIMYELFFREDIQSAMQFLEETIDKVTPLYQDRMAAISDDQQSIMLHVASIWDKCSAGQIAKASRIPPNSVSKQLQNLVKMGYLKSSTLKGNERNKLYEIDERFFAIYLLYEESSTYDRNRVLWLTKWLEAFHDKTEIIALSQRVLDDEELPCQYRLNILMAASHSSFNSQEESEEIKRKAYYALKEHMPDITQWTGNIEENNLINKFNQWLDTENYEAVTNELKKLIPEIKSEEKISEAFRLLGNSYEFMMDYRNAEKYFLKAIDNENSDAMFNLANMYKSSLKDYENAEKYYLMAIDKDNISAMYNLANMYKNLLNEYKKAEKYYLMAIDNDSPDALFNLANMYKNLLNEYEKAEKYYLLAIEKNITPAINNLASLYNEKLKDYKNAEKYYIKAIEKNDSMAMYNLANLYYHEFKEIKNAEKYFIKAIENGNEDALINLAVMYLDQHKFSFNQKDPKHESLNLIERATSINDEFKIRCLRNVILLWNGCYKEAYMDTLDLKKGLQENQENQKWFSRLLGHFLVFKQKNLLLKLFNEIEDLKEQFKLTYFYLMYELRDQYPKEYQLMPDFLQESFNDYKEYIHTLRIKYDMVVE